eukprot:CAMPEP_0168540572 /NCGR_PEP_ID=MMETSP0413-20121227/349_1 /TAXON_ID=136452 /ORGANISM="Filamoeba nolandi, Strain NC-AS-23-1" /LENGTH=92 /DNA_ID=CAMNT_0008570317 /DNA_START=18 /DNA_END=296 /DNA_ORIENTATION=+
MSLKSLQALQEHSEQGEKQLQESLAAKNKTIQTRKQLSPWVYATPLLAAPTLPLIRIALKDYPRARQYCFGGAVGFFLVHGIWLISTLKFGG